MNLIECVAVISLLGQRICAPLLRITVALTFRVLLKLKAEAGIGIYTVLGLWFMAEYPNSFIHVTSAT